MFPTGLGPRLRANSGLLLVLRTLHPKRPDTRCGTAGGTSKGRKGLGTRVEGPELQDKALGFKVWGLGFRISIFWA